MTSLSTITVNSNSIQFGDNVSITLHRTLRIPDDGKVYPLPPSLGSFPVYRVQDYARTVPQKWLQAMGVFVPIMQREAMWLSFSCPHNSPKALKLAAGKINAISGKEWSQEMVQSTDIDNQDYCVIPNQPWLDGFNAGDGCIKQFVAMPLGKGYTVEAQLTGKEDVGGIQMIVFDSKPGAIVIPEPDYSMDCYSDCCEDEDEECEEESSEMGLGAGGRMKQSIYADPYGIDCWDQTNFGRVFIHLVDSATFTKITGVPAPESTISAQTYSEHGYPWYNLYDEHVPAVKKSDILSNVKSIKEIDQEKFITPQQDDSTVLISGNQVISFNNNHVIDGNW